MKETKKQFPAEEVTLPSRGLLYPEDSPLRKGFIEMKYMTAREEDILTNVNLIENGTVIDKLLESLIKYYYECSILRVVKIGQEIYYLEDYKNDPIVQELCSQLNVSIIKINQ